MLRGFRHTLFLLLQIGTIVSGSLAVILWPWSWPAVLICVGGATVTSMLCERIAARYLSRTLGRLRRLADDVSRGRSVPPLDTHAGEDFYKLVAAINNVATRVSEAAALEQQLQAQLRRSEKLAVLGELAANVAHEINNPLDGVQNCLRILRRSGDDAARKRQMLELIEQGLARIDVIVRRLLTLARQHVIRRQPADLAAIMDAAVRACARKIESARVRVVRRNAADAQASVDAALMEQVFVNLILNACDSMPDGGELSIDVARDGDDPRSFRVDVADTGQGVPPEVLPHIFEPFFTTKRGGKGTGLGLPIAARIVDAHDGSVAVAARPGGGTVFTVRVPAGRAAQAAPSEPDTNAAPV